jgi:hypothetical protein
MTLAITALSASLPEAPVRTLAAPIINADIKTKITPALTVTSSLFLLSHLDQQEERL